MDVADRTRTRNVPQHDMKINMELRRGNGNCLYWIIHFMFLGFEAVWAVNDQTNMWVCLFFLFSLSVN